MKSIGKIAMVVVATIIAAIATSCSNDTDTTLNSQQNGIINYLKGSHQPRLIPEADVATSTDENPHFYSQWGLNIFRYIATYYDEGREQKSIIEAGDKLELSYRAYIFANSKPIIENLIATNQQKAIDELIEKGLTMSDVWTTEPLTITLGNGEILEALETAIEGCREGDSIEVYLTFESGYGNKYFGMVPNKSALVWYIDILSVTKK
mgnify:FL=1